MLKGLAALNSMATSHEYLKQYEMYSEYCWYYRLILSNERETSIILVVDDLCGRFLSHDKSLISDPNIGLTLKKNNLLK